MANTANDNLAALIVNADGCAACADGHDPEKGIYVPATAIQAGMVCLDSLVASVKATPSGKTVKVTLRSLVKTDFGWVDPQPPGHREWVRADADGRPLIHYLAAHGL
jgi:hypothetical protein